MTEGEHVFTFFKVEPPFIKETKDKLMSHVMLIVFGTPEHGMRYAVGAKRAINVSEIGGLIHILKKRHKDIGDLQIQMVPMEAFVNSMHTVNNETSADLMQGVMDELYEINTSFINGVMTDDEMYERLKVLAKKTDNNIPLCENPECDICRILRKIYAEVKTIEEITKGKFFINVGNTIQ